MSENLPAVKNGNIYTEGFGTRELATTAETSSAAVAAAKQAAIQARYIMAMRQPRDMEQTRVNLLKECKRPSFAAVARYEKPIGKDRAKWPKGPTIRFAEAALRCMGNVYPETEVIFDGEDKRIIQVSVTDLEGNLTYSSQVVIEKTVERRNANGAQVLAERKNSYGDTVYIVRATEDDLLNKQNAIISKAMRTHALRLLPGDILEECMSQVVKTLNDDAAKDPDAQKKALIDAFDELGVAPGELSAYLGHPLEKIQPKEVAELKQVYRAVRDGETTWAEIMNVHDNGSAELAAEIGKRKMAEMEQPDAAEPPAAEQAAPKRGFAFGGKK